jgi:hypothetical protein
MSIGALRYESHLRELAALALLMAVVLIIQPLPDVVGLVGEDTTTDSGVTLWLLIGSLILVAEGVVAGFVAYHSLVHNGHKDSFMKNLLLILLVGVQFSYIPYIATMVDIGKKARRDDIYMNTFIPMEYDPSKKDVHLVASMGILAVLTYAFSLVGAMAFFLFAMHAFISGTPELRPATYFRGRHLFYSFVLALAGFTQLLLGSYIQKNFVEDGGKLEYGPIGVAVYVVIFPAMNIVVGIIQLMMGMWGMLRAHGLSMFMLGSEDEGCKYFQWAMFFSWFLQFALQVLTQIGYLPGTTLSQAAPQVFCLSFGLNLMPAYLDYKMRSLPEVIDKAEYYGLEGEEMPTHAENLEDAPKELHDDDDEAPTTKVDE